MNKIEGQADAKLKRQMTRLRKRIDGADRALIAALAKRLGAVRAIGLLKTQHDLPLLQRARWKELVADRVRAGGRQGLSESFVKQILAVIHLEAIRIQKLQRKKGRQANRKRKR